jgi:hypothetical protein
MPEGNDIEFPCVGTECGHILSFSAVDPVSERVIVCPSCKKKYEFDASLMAKFEKFDRLVRAVREAEGILGDVNIGIDVEGHSVKVPYRLLLTRMNTYLTLKIGDRDVKFRFRVEPLKSDS